MRIEVADQAALDKALKKLEADDWIECAEGVFDLSGSATVYASGSATVYASDSATVRAYGSATVYAYGSATVYAYGSASVRAFDSASVSAFDSASVSAFGSASVSAFDSASVSAYDSASVRASDSASVRASGSATVYAYGSATVYAYGSATVRASRCVAVHLQAKSVVAVEGGVVIQPPILNTVELWAEHYGAEIEDGIVTLYKALDDGYKSGRGFEYAPGSTPEAPDWDGGSAECGGGLHFCASPFEAAGFFSEATRFVACPVRLDEIVMHPGGSYPQKVKAPRVCAPCWEVDLAGKRL